VRFHDRLRDREAEPRFLDRLLRRLRHPEDALEELKLLVGRDAPPGVLDRDDGRAGLKAQPDVDATAGGVKLIALDRSCAIRTRSPCTTGDAAPVTLSAISFVSASGRAASTLSATASATFSGSVSSASFPASISGEEEQVGHEPEQTVRVSLDDLEGLAVLVATSSSSTSSRKPRIEVSGVRSSCETRAMDSSFSRSSSRSRSFCAVSAARASEPWKARGSGGSAGPRERLRRGGERPELGSDSDRGAVEHSSDAERGRYVTW